MQQLPSTPRVCRAEQIAAVSSATLQAVEEALTLIVKPVKAGVRLGIEHVRMVPWTADLLGRGGNWG